MDFPAVIATLRECKTLLTAAEIADISGVHFSTINRWIKELDFPKSVGCERTRLFTPLQVVAWFEVQEREARDMLTIEQVCERVGIYPQTYIKWVKRGRAPSPKRRVLGSARQLWDVDDIREFMALRMGGLPRPASMALKKTHSKRITREARRVHKQEKNSAAAH